MIPFPVSPRFPKDRFDTALKLASGVQVQWEEDAAQQPGLMPGTEHAWIEVYLRSDVDIGWDERLTETDNTTSPPTQRALTIGRRECVLSLNAWSLSAKLRAFDLLERVRFGFNRDAVLAGLRPIAAIRWCERITTFPKATRDGRAIYRAQMDVAASYVIAADTLDPAANGYVLSVNGGGPVPGTFKP